MRRAYGVAACRLELPQSPLKTAGAAPGVVQIRVTPKTRNPFTIKALSISGVTWKWHFLNHALYRAIDRSGALVDVIFSGHRDMVAARAFFRSAKAVTGVRPDRVTTDGHDTYPRAIRTELGHEVRHRTSAYLNNRLEQDHRGVEAPHTMHVGLQELRIGGALLSKL